MGAKAQTKIDFSKFKPLESTGVLPEEVEMTGKDFMLTSQKNITKGGSKKDKNAKEKFVVESSYAIKELFISGRVLYNDPITDYVEKIRKEITASDPQLAAETKVFVIKSSVINAFATNQGYIFITTGLLSQLENEAQLAFVLSHEMMHYKKKHVFKAYVKNEKIDRGEGGYRKSEVDKKYLAKSNYSKEHETEADVLGFELFSKTDYSLDAIDGTFDVLKYSELPFEDFEFTPKALLETEFLKFPIDYIKEEVDEPEGADEEADDKYSTHPNLKKRRDDVKDKINELEGADKTKPRRLYMVSEDLFKDARELARFDLCHTSLIERNYDRSFYEAYCLLETHPDNLYLKKVVLKSLYGLSKYSNSKRFREVALKPKNVQGESQRLNYMLDKFESNELNVVALNFAWRLKTKLHNEDVEVNLITDDLFYEMVKKHYPNRTSFSTEPRATPIDTVRKEVEVKEPEETAKKTTTKKGAKKEGGYSRDGEKDDEEEEPTKTATTKKTTKPTKKTETKTSKLKKKKKVDEKEYFVTYAFVDLLKDPDFVAEYDRLAKQAKKDKSEEKKEVSRRKNYRKKNKMDASESDDVDNQYLMDEKEVAKKYNDKWDCYALGMEKILILNPFYLKIDERKKTPVSYAGSDEAQKKFNDRINQIAGDIKLDVEYIDKKTFNSASVDNYNDMGVLIDWMDERIDHKRLKIIPTDYTRIEEITKKYGTENLAITGAINFIEKKRGIGLAIAISVLLPVYSWLFTIPYFVTKSTHTYVYTIVFNLKTGQLEMVNVGSAPLSDKKDVVGSYLYDHLMQIKRKGENKNN